MLLGKLAIKENNIKGLVKSLDLSKINFNEIAKDIEEVIRVL